MKKKMLFLAVTLLLMYASLRVGLHLGATKAFDVWFNQNVDQAATEVEVKVKTLKMLKKGENEKAEEFLERFIDNDLGFLAVNAENRHLKEKGKLMDAIKFAKAYRERHPEHQVEKTLNSGVVKAFGLAGK